MDWDMDASSSVSAGSGSSGTTLVAVAEEEEEEKTEEEQQTGGGVLNAVLLLIVKFILAGVQGAVVTEWLLGKALEVLIWAVELVMVLIQPPG
jgi:hypothetical protein